MRRLLLIWIGVAALLLAGGVSASAGDLSAAIELENHALAHVDQKAILSADLRAAIVKLKSAQATTGSTEAAGLIAKAIELSNAALATSSSAQRQIDLRQAVIYASYADASSGETDAHPFGCRGIAAFARLTLSGCSVSVSGVTIAFPRALKTFKLALVSTAYKNGYVSASCHRLATAKIHCGGLPVHATAFLDFTPKVRTGEKLMVTLDYAGKHYALPVTA